jgi:hypothetical protein
MPSSKQALGRDGFSATGEPRELERFFMAKDKVHQTLRRVVKNLSKAKIEYAVAQEIEDIHYVNLPTLIELKLAARRWRDFADVVELIRFNELDESFLPKLHQSVRSNFIECLEEKLREHEYEAQG